MMRVLQLAQRFSPLTQTFVYDLIRALEDAGVETHVAAESLMNLEDRPVSHLQSTVLGPWKRRTLKVLEATIGGRYPHTVGSLRHTLWTRSLRQLVSRVRPDVVHCQFGPMGYAVRNLPIPVVTTFHGYDATRLLEETAWRRRYQYLFQRGAHFIAVSDHIREKLIAAGAPEDKTTTVRNGIVISEVSYSDAAERYDGKRVHTLFVGRLVAKKAPLQLISSFVAARSALLPEIEMTLTIAGDGPLESQCRDLAVSLGVSKSVHFLGSVTHQTVFELLGSHHILAQPYRTAPDGDQEGLPIILMEAAAAGLPVVTTRHSGRPQLVDSKTGVLVEEDDGDAFARAMESLARSPSEWSRMGNAARRRVEEYSSIERQVRETLAVYEKAMERDHRV